MKKRALEELLLVLKLYRCWETNCCFLAKARKPFEQVADIYKEKVKDNGKNTKDYRKAFTSLSGR